MEGKKNNNKVNLYIYIMRVLDRIHISSYCYNSLKKNA